MGKVKNWILIFIFLAVCLSVSGIFGIFTGSSDLGNIFLKEDSALFRADSGKTTELTLPAYDAPRTDGVYTVTYTMEKNETDIDVILRFGTGNAQLLIDNRIVYSGEISAPDSLVGVPSVKATVEKSGKDRELTVNVRYKDLHNYIFPPIISAESAALIDQHMAAATNLSALPAGMSGAVFILLIGLFFISAAFFKPDFSLLFLAFGVGCYCFSLLFGTGAVGVQIQSGFLAAAPGAFPYITFICILIYLILNRKKRSLKYFMIISFILSGIIMAAYVLTLIIENVPLAIASIGALADLLYSRAFSTAISLAAQYLILICTAATLIDQIRSISKIISEKSVLETQAAAVASGYANIVSTAKRTESMRHEWKNDLLTLGMFYEQKRLDDLGAYLKKKNAQLSELDRVHYTENFVFDVILNSASARAQNEGIRFESNVNIPKNLPVKDEDLCSLLMNMFDNAFHACQKVEAEKRHIYFRAVLTGNFLAISCSNSTSDAPPEAEENGGDLSHGWGLQIMRRICQAYNSDLVTANADGIFTVKTALQLKR